MLTELSAIVVHHEKMRCTGTTPKGIDIAMDYPPPLGDGNGIMPLEMLLISLAGCSCNTVAILLNRMNQTFSSLEVHTAAVRREEHPTIFTSVSLEFVIGGTGIDPGKVEKAISLSEQQLCPVWAMLKPGTSITSTYKLIG